MDSFQLGHSYGMSTSFINTLPHDLLNSWWTRCKSVSVERIWEVEESAGWARIWDTFHTKVPKSKAYLRHVKSLPTSLQCPGAFCLNLWLFCFVLTFLFSMIPHALRIHALSLGTLVWKESQILSGVSICTWHLRRHQKEIYLNVTSQ